MSAHPDWLRWIKPAPKGEEVSSLIEQFRYVVANVQHRETKAQTTLELPAMEEALHAIQALPEALRDRPDIKRFLHALQSKIRWAGPKPKGLGRRREATKRWCLISTVIWLHDQGKKASGGITGTIPNLAMAVWEAAGYLEKGDNLVAWAQAWNRIRKEQKEIWIQIEKDKQKSEKA